MKSVPLIDPIFMSGVKIPDKANLLQHWHDRKFGILESDRIYFGDNSTRGESFRNYQPGRCYNGDGSAFSLASGVTKSTVYSLGFHFVQVDAEDPTAFRLVDLVYSSGRRIFLSQLSGGTTTLSVFTESGTFILGTVPFDTDFHFILFEENEGFLTTYFDGNMLSQDVPVPVFDFPTVFYYLYASGSSNKIDEPMFDNRLFNRILTTEEKIKFQNHEVVDGAIAWYKMDESAGDITYDSSGNGFHGSISNITTGFHSLQSMWSFQNELGFSRYFYARNLSPFNGTRRILVNDNFKHENFEYEFLTDPGGQNPNTMIGFTDTQNTDWAGYIANMYVYNSGPWVSLVQSGVFGPQTPYTRGEILIFRATSTTVEIWSKDREIMLDSAPRNPDCNFLEIQGSGSATQFFNMTQIIFEDGSRKDFDFTITDLANTTANYANIPRDEIKLTSDALNNDLLYDGKAQGYGVLENLPCGNFDDAAVYLDTQRVPDITGSISLRVKIDQIASTWGCIAGSWDGVNDRCFIEARQDLVTYFIGVADSLIDTQVSLVFDEWHTLKLDWNDTTKEVNFSINDKIVYSGTFTGTLSSTNDIFIGKLNNGGTGISDTGFRGQVCDYQLRDSNNDVVQNLPIAESNGEVAYDAINGASGLWKSFNLNNVWSQKQNIYAHNQLNGFSRRLSFNGVDSSVDLMEPPTSQGAIEFYMYSTDYEVDSTVGIFSCVGTGVDERFHIQITARSLQLVFGDNVGSSTYVLTNGQQYKIRVEWNGSTNNAVVYVDDVVRINYDWVGNLPSDNTISIGCWKTSANAKFYFFLGLIWDVKFYDAPTGGNLNRYWPINDLWNNNAKRIREYDGSTNRDDYPDPNGMKLADQEWFAISMEILDLTSNRYLIGYPVFNFRQWGVYYFSSFMRWFVSSDGSVLVNGQAVATNVGQTHFGMIGHFNSNQTLISQWLGTPKATTIFRPIFQQNTNSFGFGATSAGSPCKVRAAFYGKAPGGISAQFDEIFAALSAGSNFSIHPAELTQKMISDYGIQHAWSFNENGDIYDWVGSANLVQFGTPGTIITSDIVKEVNGYNGKIQGNPNWIDFSSANPELKPGRTWLPALEEFTDWVDQSHTLGNFPWAFSSGTLSWPNSYSIGNSDLGRYSNTDDQFSQIRRDYQRKFFHYRNELTGNDLSSIKKYIEKE